MDGCWEWPVYKDTNLSASFLDNTSYKLSRTIVIVCSSRVWKPGVFWKVWSVWNSENPTQIQSDSPAGEKLYITTETQGARAGVSGWGGSKRGGCLLQHLCCFCPFPSSLTRTGRSWNWSTRRSCYDQSLNNTPVKSGSGVKTVREKSYLK